MPRFSLFRRGASKVYYVQFPNPDTGKMTTAKSTGAKSKNEATSIVLDWLRFGIPAKQGKTQSVAERLTFNSVLTGVRTLPLVADDVSRILEVLKERGFIESATLKGSPGSVLFNDFLLNFWNYDTSPYVKEKLAHCQSIGRRHCYESTMKVKSRWEDAFQGKLLAEVTKQDLKAFSLALTDEEEELSPASLNRILEVGTTALRWAINNDLIAVDPSIGLARFAGTAKKRGILLEEEARKLFLAPWKDERARIGNLLAMTTGMRAGEVLALRLDDIKGNRIHVRHSWSVRDGLKKPKSGKVCTIIHISHGGSWSLEICVRSYIFLFALG